MRTSLERPDAITASAISAREQIGMAVADKIRQMESARELEKVAEDVLPPFEKFLESPEEKRLRRIRAGVVTAAIGLGLTLISLLMAFDKTDFFPFVTPGLVTFLVGVGIVLNGLLFTVPSKTLPGTSLDALSQKVLDAGQMEYEAPLISATTNNLSDRGHVSSVTEHTTHHLNSNKQ